jgi:hypothetical protein
MVVELVPFLALAGFPGCKIAAEDEELTSDLDYRNSVFLNDSTEMPNREACHLRGCRNIQEHFSSWLRRARTLCVHLVFPPSRCLAKHLMFHDAYRHSRKPSLR